MNTFVKMFIAEVKVPFDPASDLNVVFIGLFVVFIALALMILFINLLSRFFRKNKSKAGSTTQNHEPSQKLNNSSVVISNNNSESDEDLVAIFTACILSCIENNNGSTLVVRSFKRISGNSTEWNRAGRRESIESRF